MPPRACDMCWAGQPKGLSLGPAAMWPTMLWVLHALHLSRIAGVTPPHLHPHPFHRYRPAIEGTPPTPREQAVATFWAGSMIIFGECHSTCSLNNMAMKPCMNMALNASPAQQCTTSTTRHQHMA
jgi:hypothetical protein